MNPVALAIALLGVIPALALVIWFAWVACREDRQERARHTFEKALRGHPPEGAPSMPTQPPIPPGPLPWPVGGRGKGDPRP